MFVPRSARRIRFARAAFLMFGLVPCLGLGVWAVYRHSAGHRDVIRTRWEQAVGLPLSIASVEHPLPGVVRARECSLVAPDGRPVLEVAAVAVETSPTEVRIGMGSLACDPAGAALLARLAAEWLERGARFRRDVVVDIDDFAWQLPGSDGRTARHALGPVRVECVAQGDGRAVRIVRRAADDDADEVRILRSTEGGGATGPGSRFEIEASCAEPLPVVILAAAMAGSASGLPVGPTTTLQGRLAATWSDGRWAGTASGRVGNVDLARCTAALPGGATGIMDVEVRSVEWRHGRLTACDFACDVTGGTVDRRLLEALVATMGCRAGPVYVGATVERERAFDAAGCEVRIDGRGIRVAGASRLGGALALADGRSLLEPPPGAVSPERFAWLLAPQGSVYVPSSGPGGWLMSVLPSQRGTAERTSQADPSREVGDF